MIDELNGFMQHRFVVPPQTQQANPLGMSRVAVPGSLHDHYLPNFNNTRDFTPENNAEAAVITRMESVHLQTGLYVFGRAVLNADPLTPSFRALKGPAAVTAVTPRPSWYPTGTNPAATGDALPDWKTIYPLAKRAMKSFADGGSGFETSIGRWQIAARPVFASEEKCVACHNSALGRMYSGFAQISLNQAVGGVIYAFRRGGV